jgi:hypothetical protein
VLFTLTKTLAFVVCLAAGTTVAQPSQELPATEVVSTCVKALGYQVGGGSTESDLKVRG